MYELWSVLHNNICLSDLKVKRFYIQTLFESKGRMKMNTVTIKFGPGTANMERYAGGRKSFAGKGLLD